MWGRWIGWGVAAWAINCSLGVCVAQAQADPPIRAVNVAQGWNDQQKAYWYQTSQGSRLLPLEWLRALEQPGTSQKKFLDPDYIRSFRYLPDSAPSKIGLPVGFAIDQQDDRGFTRTKLRWKQVQDDDEQWVGMNCAACHTAEITYNARRMRIEGGPTLADFQSFIEAINKALKETKDQADKAKRFADLVLNGPNENTPANRAMLVEALSHLIEWQTKVEKANAIPKEFYGFGRLDAFGHIFNKVALSVERQDIRQTFHPSNAPVSYPFLWNVPQHNQVQWNGIAKKILIRNFDVGALARNVGEVTGVFADTTWFVPVQPSDSAVVSSPSIKSSAELDQLREMENLLERLRPPMWPTGTLGVIDDKKRDKGRELFIAKDRKFADGRLIPACSECHKGLPRNNLRLPIKANMIPLKDIGTDIWMACNAVAHEASSGILFGSVKTPLGPAYRETAPISTLLTTTVAETIIGDLGSVFRGVSQSFSSRATPDLGASEGVSNLPANLRPRERCMTGTDPLLAYKARPLTGIWATAPYLHNGSVPTLYDLLLPADQRPRKFLVGTREFDTKRVGYVTRDAADNLLETPAGDNSFVFNTRDATGGAIDGNSNAGHDYGNDLFTDDDRWALVEYMKGL